MRDLKEMYKDPTKIYDKLWNFADKQVPSDYQQYYEAVKHVARAEDVEVAAREMLEVQVPEEYKPFLKTAEKAMKKAIELKKKKDELQIDLFEAIIDPVWEQADPDGQGYIGEEQCADFARLILKEIKQEDKFNEELFKQGLQCINKMCREEDDERPLDQLITKRKTAELANYLILGGL